MDIETFEKIIMHEEVIKYLRYHFRKGFEASNQVLLTLTRLAMDVISELHALRELDDEFHHQELKKAPAATDA